MTVDEYTLERVVRDRRFDERTVEIVRRLFLDGDPPRQVAKEFGVIDKRVYAIRSTVLAHVATYKMDEGWTEHTFRGPVALVKEAEKYFANLMKEAGIDPQTSRS